MAPGRFRFDQFLLDPDNRQLRRGDEPVELNTRYLDALALLVREQGALVTKDRFMDDVWRGVPVTDEALTQCIRTLRRQLGDDATNPRFIETVPKHGYRFIASVEAVGDEPASLARPMPDDWRPALRLGAAGMIGGGVAGAFGGLFYGFGASQPLDPGVGAASVLVVLMCVNVAMGLIGGAGVGFGIAAGRLIGQSPLWSIAGGAFGGLIVGAAVKLIGIDAFNLLFGRSPGDITGALEGALLGAAIGLAAWFASRSLSLNRGIAAGALTTGGAGVLIALLGGRLMGGSLDLLSDRFQSSRLELDHMGALFGESDFGPVTRIVTSGVEGLVFGAFVVGALVIALRRK